MRIAFIFLAMVQFSCEGPYRNCKEYYFDDEFKSHTYFKPGSYWVYEDTVYNVIDSTTLISQIVTFEEDCNSHSYPHEKIEHKFTSTFFNDPPTAIIEGHADENKYNETETPPLGYYFKPVGESEENYKVDSIIIKGLWYHDVRIITTSFGKYYWAKNVGLIKKSLYRDFPHDTLYNFELIRYKLN